MSAIKLYKHYIKTNVFKIRDKIKLERKPKNRR
jgi:hypothetical protein